MNNPMTGQASFQFKNYTFKNLSLIMSPDFDARNSYKIDFHLDIDVHVLNDDEGSVTLSCNIKGEEAFFINAEMTGVFHLVEYSKDIDFEKFLRLNGTTVMYPYLRSAISDLTKICNIQPLTLPLINVTHFLEK